MPTSIISSSLIPSNTTTLPSVTSVPPYPTVNQNSTYTGATGTGATGTGATGTVSSPSVYSYPSASASITGHGNFSAIATPKFTGAAGKEGAKVNLAMVAVVWSLGWGLLMG